MGTYVFAVINIEEGDKNPKLLDVDYGRFDNIDSARSYARALAFDWHVDWSVPVRVSFMLMSPDMRFMHRPNPSVWDEYCPIF